MIERELMIVDKILIVFYPIKVFLTNPFIDLKKKKLNNFFLTSSNLIQSQKKNLKVETMTTSTQLELLKEEDVQKIIQYWIRILKIKSGWIHDFDKTVVNYIITFFIFDAFQSSSKLLKTFTGHTNTVWSIDYATFDDGQFICSGSSDNTVCVWDIESNKQIRQFNEYSGGVYCVKFSQYHYHNKHRNVICSSSGNTVYFWDIKDSRQLQIFDEHAANIIGIEFSSFNSGRYLCSGSSDNTIRLWDVETSKSLHVFNGHESGVWCVDISPLQSNNNNDNNKSNSIGLIGGNGYTICSGSWDKTIRIWDIETTKQLVIFKGHKEAVSSVKYGLNELGINGGSNTILSGSDDCSVCLWDIRSGQQIRVFSEHENIISCVEYSPFVVSNIEIGDNSNVICSGSWDNTIHFWDMRSTKNKLHVINGNKEDKGIICLKFVSLKKKNNKVANGANLYYGSKNGLVFVLNEFKILCFSNVKIKTKYYFNTFQFIKYLFVQFHEDLKKSIQKLASKYPFISYEFAF
ncbi:G-protein beta WD-40 repeats containing protein [Reticulomyxa filosa]|uniref:G-protein beta WD-40 repeats containing protein n=1 Tax=Reticulomyxa filosa TaxID=46433 RepID=X6MR28_RETFI|nr:G-protein beta WD-40 repeats containing protein [Reticulomyxa filosa]|eukprot:ETO15560.1 G-protein beta WD-40 repeats containing protein [Reticulomyxa filosa]